MTARNPKYQTPEGKPLKPVTPDDPFLSVAFHDRNLCARTGCCTGVCPTGAITVGEDKYPRLDADKCIACGLCGEVCPGGEVMYGDLAEHTFGERFVDIGFDGRVEKTYVGYATDTRFRKGGAGGGLVTALLHHLLKTGRVDGCLATRMNAERPWRAEPFIATRYEELTQSQGSRYQIVPMNAMWAEMRKREGRFAVAILPCQVHGFRKLQRKDPELAARIEVVVGLFCGGALEPWLTTEMLTMRGIDKEEIRDFQFRGGEWPGQMRAVFKDGRPPKPLHYSNYKDGAYNYFTSLYMPERCQTCLDGSNEFADVSVSDAWTRDDKGEYKFKEQSRLLVRTPAGAELVASAVEAGDLVVQDVTADPSYKTHKLQTKRKGSLAPLRVERWGKRGRPVPRYDRGVPEDVTRKERLLEILASSLLRAGRWKPFRMGVMGFLTSKYAIPLIKLRMFRKKRKYAKRRAAKEKAARRAGS